MKLQDLAQVVRSKNAGPRRFTLDIIFRDDADYQRAAQSEAITPETVAPLYDVNNTRRYLPPRGSRNAKISSCSASATSATRARLAVR